MASRNPLRIIFLVVFLDLLGFGIVIPQLGIYGYRFGATGFEVGLLGSVYSLMQFVFAPAFGRVSDRLGRRPVLLFSLAGSVAGYLIFGLAPTLAWLFVGRLVQGVCGANISTAQAYIADVTPPEGRARALGMYLGAAFGLGFIFGPAVGSALAHWGNLGLGLAAAAMSASGWLVAARWLPESNPPERRAAHPGAPVRVLDLRRVAEVARLPGVSRVVLVFTLATLAFSMMEGTFALFLLSRFFAAPRAGSLAELAARGSALAQQAGRWTGAVFVAVGVVATLVQGGLIGRLRARFGEARLASVGATLLCTALGLVPLMPSLGLLFAPMTVLALGNGLATPSLSSLVSQLAPRARQGEVIGVYQSLGSLARAVGPALGGLAFQQLGEGAPFFVASGLMALAVLASLPLLRLALPGVGESPPGPA